MGIYLNNVKVVGGDVPYWSMAGVLDRAGSFLTGGKTYILNLIEQKVEEPIEGSNKCTIFTRIGAIFKKIACMLDDRIHAKYDSLTSLSLTTVWERLKPSWNEEGFYKYSLEVPGLGFSCHFIISKAW